MNRVQCRWRPLALGLAAALILNCAAVAAQTNLPLSERIQQCAACHGEDGNSRIAQTPSLAGQPEFFVMNQLVLMREGVRQVEAMMPIVRELKDEDIFALAKHYASLQPRPSEEKIDPVLVKRGAQIAAARRCSSCHLPTLAGQDQMPRLAKQRIDYMIYAMKSYLVDERRGADTLMTAAIAGLSEDDLAALAHYAASR
jgi:cytochrome c553